MAAPTNMDFFNTFTLAMFKVLLENFPSPADINATKIALDLLPEKLSDEDGLRLFTAADNSVLWLQKEGFITVGYTSLDSGSEFSDVLLTSRGLALLNSVPEVLGSKETVGTQIGDLLADAGKDMAKEEVKTGIRALMLYVTKVAAGWAISGSA